jgi:hypothetical protein
MKPIENNTQLLERFTKRSMQLSKQLSELEPQYQEYLKIKRDLERLEGSVQVVKYLEYGILPNDGNHDGMQNHRPNKQDSPQ